MQRASSASEIGPWAKAARRSPTIASTRSKCSTSSHALIVNRLESRCKEKSQLNAQGELAPVETRPIDDLCNEILTKNVGLDTLERRLMQTALKQAKGNLSQAARVLGITRPQLAYRLKKEGIPLE